MSRSNRIIFSDSGTLTDYSNSLNNVLSGTVTIPFETVDYLYIGSDMPFNHRYFDVSTANAIASVMSVSLWTGSSWVAAVDVMDATSSSGKTLAQSGIISWSPDWDLSSWSYDDTDNITGLTTGPKIKQLYWARLAVSVNITPTAALKSVKFKFSEDEDLTSEYPELANTSLMTAYSAGKTNWKDQTMLAADYVIQDLKAMNVIMSPNQILAPDLFKKASVHKTASIIFSAFGDDYKDQRLDSIKSYKECMQLKYFQIDQNLNAEIDQGERGALSTFLTR